MSDTIDGLKAIWLAMLTPPWQIKNEDGRDKFFFTLVWLTCWTWALAGIVFGALLSPYLLEVWGPASSSSEDWLVVGIASLAGFLVQFIGWCFLLLVYAILGAIFDFLGTGVGDVLGYTIFFVLIPLPLIAVGYAIYLYTTTLGNQAGLVTTGVIGGILLKIAITLGVPLLKSLIVGFIFARFMISLRGGNKK